MSTEVNKPSTTSGSGLVPYMAALALSWLKWHSMGLAIVHGCFGWIYVVYNLTSYH